MFVDYFWLVVLVVRFNHSVCVASCVLELLFWMFDFERRIEGQLRFAVPHLTIVADRSAAGANLKSSFVACEC
jgi:hypothetical protein